MMTPERFKEIRAQLDWSVPATAKELKLDARTVRRYEAGSKPIPGPVEVLMEQFCESDLFAKSDAYWESQG